MNQHIIDITHPIHAGSTRVWPGDNVPNREFLMRIENGDSVTLSTLHSTVHLGTHADGPCHYDADGQGVGEMDLNHYIGPCRVVRVEVEPGSRVTIEDLGDTPLDAARIIIDTGTFRFKHFNEDFAGLSPELIDHLADHDVVTVGLDSPSVDLLNDRHIVAHGRCNARSIAILETLKLTDVDPGRYQLCAQPLKLVDFDGSPVRAVLLPESKSSH